MSRLALILALIALALSIGALGRSQNPCRANERPAYVTVEDGPGAGRFLVCNEVESVPRAQGR